MFEIRMTPKMIGISGSNSSEGSNKSRSFNRFILNFMITSLTNGEEDPGCCSNPFPMLGKEKYDG